MAANRDRPGLKCPQCSIEFIGGPFDGHVELFPAPAEQLPQDVIRFVRANVFHILDRKRQCPRQPITSIALYERKRRRDAWCYLFVGAMSPKELT